MASVLIIAVDPNIESLLTQLVAFAGHRSMIDVTSGASGESIRRIRPDVALIDTTLPHAVVEACVGAADEVGARPILTSGVDSATELATEARHEHCPYFPLPGGPKPLADVIERALRSHRSAPTVIIARTEHPPIHPAFCSALANVARARVIMMQAEAAQAQNRERRQDMVALLDETRRNRDALRAAVTEYATELKTSDISNDEVLLFVRNAVSDCANVMGADSALPMLLLESEKWARQACAAA